MARRAICENEGSGTTFHCLPICETRNSPTCLSFFLSIHGNPIVNYQIRDENLAIALLSVEFVENGAIIFL